MRNHSETSRHCPSAIWWAKVICVVVFASPAACGQMFLSLNEATEVLPSDADFQQRWFLADSVSLDAIFDARVRLYARCLLNWAGHTAELSDAQRDICQTALQPVLDELVVRQEAHEVGVFCGFLPLKFVSAAEQIDVAFEQAVKQPNVLSAEQLAKFQRAMSARRGQHKRDNLAGLIARIDRELLLSDSRIRQLEKEAPDHLDLTRAGFDDPFGASSEQRLTFLLIASPLAETWTPHQRQRAGLLASRLEVRPLVPGADEAEAEPSGESLTLEKQRSLVTVQLQLDLFREAGLISATQERQFQAWTGRYARALPSAQNPQNLPASGQPVSLPMTAVSSSLPWKVHRQIAVPPLSAFEQRRQAAAKGRLAQFIVGMLDRELWLTPQQREILLQHTQLVIPNHWMEPTSHPELYAGWSFITLAAAINRLNETQGAEELSEDQWKAFLLMRESVWGGLNSTLLIPDTTGSEWTEILSMYGESWHRN